MKTLMRPNGAFLADYNIKMKIRIDGWAIWMFALPHRIAEINDFLNCLRHAELFDALNFY